MIFFPLKIRDRSLLMGMGVGMGGYKMQWGAASQINPYKKETRGGGIQDFGKGGGGQSG